MSEICPLLIPIANTVVCSFIHLSLLHYNTAPIISHHASRFDSPRIMETRSAPLSLCCPGCASLLGWQPPCIQEEDWEPGMKPMAMGNDVRPEQLGQQQQNGQPPGWCRLAPGVQSWLCVPWTGWISQRHKRKGKCISRRRNRIFCDNHLTIFSIFDTC